MGGVDEVGSSNYPFSLSPAFHQPCQRCQVAETSRRALLLFVSVTVFKYVSLHRWRVASGWPQLRDGVVFAGALRRFVSLDLPKDQSLCLSRRCSLTEAA